MNREILGEPMSEENLEIVQRGYEAFNSKDADAYIALSHPDISFSPMTAGVQGSLRGHAAIRTWLAEMAETFAESKVVANEFEVVEDVVIVHATFHGRGHSSDAAVAQPLVHVVRIRDGLVTWFGAYRDRAEALQAAGLSQ